MSKRFPRVKTLRGKRVPKGAVRLAPGEVLVKLGDEMARIAQYPPHFQPELPAKGATIDNMAPSKGVGGKSPIVVLQQGLDTVVLSVWGSLREDVAELLAMAKEEAQEAELGEALSPLPPFAGTVPLMQAMGVPYYDYHLTTDDIDIIIRKPGRGTVRASAVITLRSSFLWRMGGGGVTGLKLGANYLYSQYEGAIRVVPRRVDLATDFQGHVPTFDDVNATTKRALPRVYREVPDEDDTLGLHYGYRGTLQSIAAGKSNNLRLNLYDKRAQVKKTGKTWVIALWEGCEGYRPDEAVWRTEFQHGRKLLHAKDIETVESLIAALPSLWADGLRWFCFRAPTNDGSKKRWPVAAWWASLAPWCKVTGVGLAKVKVVRARWARVASGLAGYLTSAMALCGVDSPQQALQFAIKQANEGDASKLDRRLEAKKLKYSGFTMASA